MIEALGHSPSRPAEVRRCRCRCRCRCSCSCSCSRLQHPRPAARALLSAPPPSALRPRPSAPGPQPRPWPPAPPAGVCVRGGPEALQGSAVPQRPGRGAGHAGQAGRRGAHRAQGARRGARLGARRGVGAWAPGRRRTRAFLQRGARAGAALGRRALMMAAPGRWSCACRTLMAVCEELIGGGSAAGPAGQGPQARALRAGTGRGGGPRAPPGHIAPARWLHQAAALAAASRCARSPRRQPAHCGKGGVRLASMARRASGSWLYFGGGRASPHGMQPPEDPAHLYAHACASMLCVRRTNRRVPSGERGCATAPAGRRRGSGGGSGRRMAAAVCVPAAVGRAGLQAARAAL
jgi:hypothetical protein